MHAQTTQSCMHTQTCDYIPDGLNKGSKGSDFWLSVFPHWLPNDKTTGKTKGQIRFLKIRIKQIVELF